MSGNLWMFSDMLDDEDIEILKGSRDDGTSSSPGRYGSRFSLRKSPQPDLPAGVPSSWPPSCLSLLQRAGSSACHSTDPGPWQMGRCPELPQRHFRRCLFFAIPATPLPADWMYPPERRGCIPSLAFRHLGFCAGAPPRIHRSPGGVWPGFVPPFS